MILNPWIIAIFILATLVILLFWKILRIIKIVRNLQSANNNLGVEKSFLQENLHNLNLRNHQLEERVLQMEQENRSFASYQGRFEQALVELDCLKSEKKFLHHEIKNLHSQILEFEKQNELLKQSSVELIRQREEWSKQKEVALFKLSEELLKKNQEQQNQLSKNQAENLCKITENLFKNFEEVASKITSLNEDVKKSNEAINLTKNALLNPAGAGRLAEITLENILKNSNLKEKSDIHGVGDYILQSYFTAIELESKRPDAILFLPNNNIVVIDAKSSSHFLELQRIKELSLSENSEINYLKQEKEIIAKIKESTKRHIDDLKKRDYGHFLAEELKAKNLSDYKISLIMFLQTEQILEIIKNADNDFEQRALNSGIIVATPIGLIHLLSQIRYIIDRVKQEENIEILKMEVKKLLDNLALIFKESQELGRSLNKSLNIYNKLAKNLNRGVLTRTKNIADLGIATHKSSEIKKLEEYIEAEESE
jgi:DNA recombination protein RmuC